MEVAKLNNTTSDRLAEIHALQRELSSSPSSIEVVNLAMATAISWRLSMTDRTSPVWLLIAGAPSSDKTRSIESLYGASHVCFVDTFTENGMISSVETKSGEVKRGGFLAEVAEGTLVIKDLTTMLSLRSQRVNKLLGELQSVFDGRIKKATGLGPESIMWEGHLSFVGCVTPQSLEAHYRYMTQIGGRFLIYRVPRQDRAQHREGVRKGKLRDVRTDRLGRLTTLVHEHINALLMTPTEIDNEAPEVDDLIIELAELIALGRASIIWTRDRDSIRTIDNVQIEEPYRVAQQLTTLLRSLVALRGASTPSAEDLELLKRVAFDTINADRLAVLNTLTNGPQPKTVIDAKLGCSWGKSSEVLNELEAVELIKESDPDGNRAVGRPSRTYGIVNDFTHLFTK